MSKNGKQRAALKTNFQKEAGNVESLFQSKQATTTKLRPILIKLESYYERISALNENILTALEDDAEVDSEIDNAAKYDEFMMDKISTLKSVLQNADLAAQTQTEKSVARNPGVGTVKLPKLEIEKYSGDSMKWREFWDSFCNTIDKNAGLSEIDKFKYLKSFLGGDALRLSEGYTLSTENYTAVKAALVDRFGNPQLAIFSHLTALIERPVATHSVKDLQAVYDNCEKHVRSLVGLGLGEEQYGLVFTPIILSKLPLHVKMELHRKNGSDLWTLSKLRELLRQEIHARDMSSRQFLEHVKDHPHDPKSAKNGKPQSGQKGYGPRPSGQMLPQTGGKPSGRRACQYCSDQGHRSDECSKFPDYQSRREKLGKACLNCLGSTHVVKDCKSKKSCVHCSRKGHHSSLCFSLFPQTAPQQFHAGSGTTTPSAAGPTLDPNAPYFAPSNKGASAGMISTPQTAHGTGIASYTQMQTALASCSGSSGAMANLRLLFDTGGFRSYITLAAASRIRAKKVGRETMSVGVFEGRRRPNRTYDVVEFHVTARDGSVIPLQANVTDYISCPVVKQPVDLRAHAIVATLPLAEPMVSQVRTLDIDILIGGDQYYDIVTSEQIRCSDGLVFLSSKLGYIVAGVSKKDKPDVNTAHSPHLLLSASLPLGDSSRVLAVGGHPASDSCFDIERFWRLEDIGIKDSSFSTDDEVALEQFKSTTVFVEGRYFVRWPRRCSADGLPENRELALGRLRSLLNRLRADPAVLRTYGDLIQDQLARGIIEEAPAQPVGQVSYLPHHCVLKPQSLTTPVRIVYDASAKSKASNPSLNDTLYSGPLFLADLVGLLIRFRIDEVAIVSDIEKAFLHIGIQESDRDLVRFFWIKDLARPPRNDNLVTYRFCRVPFGLVCSAFLLAVCLYLHFAKYKEPTARFLEQNLYVDNVIVSFPDVESAISYYQSSKRILSDASMNLRQWYSNSSGFRSALADNDKGKGGSITSVLGMSWDTATDLIRCPDVTLDPLAVTTKRHVMQFVASLSMTKVTLGELQTLIMEISACLNSRPITYVDSDPNSVPLCPANFLLNGRPIKLLSPHDEEVDQFASETYRDQLILAWHRNKSILDNFWKIWQRAYLTALKERERAHQQRAVDSSKPEVGMTVFVSDSGPRGQWKLGRISSLRESSDGQVRSAEVVLPSGFRMWRPIKSLCPLEGSHLPTRDHTATQNSQSQRQRPQRHAAQRARKKLKVAFADESENEDELF